MKQIASKSAIHAICFLSFMIAFPVISFGELASWLKVKYSPVQDKIESIPIQSIDKDWSKVLVLSKENQPQDVLKDLEDRERHGYRFQLEGDFNKDGEKDKALVGVYIDKAGVVGRFLLILTNAKAGVWEKTFLYKSPGESGFSILFYEKGHLSFSACMDCDDFADLIWEKGNYRLKWNSCC
ncbi:MAG: hypothetical protein HY203_00435 [Nitrospirae bacterium]|nr:hypothetical protein [Nitrospirota bacterium]